MARNNIRQKDFRDINFFVDVPIIHSHQQPSRVEVATSYSLLKDYAGVVLRWYVTNIPKARRPRHPVKAFVSHSKRWQRLRSAASCELSAEGAVRVDIELSSIQDEIPPDLPAVCSCMN
eukprot:scaffold6271_cov171-Amphora_coffeaeformis.AAC.5